MINIFCVTATPSGDGASIPRVHSIKHLEETGYPCQVQVASHIAPFDIAWADLVVIHRPVDLMHLEVSKKVKEMKKKLWVDNDDDQLNMPFDHHAYFQYKLEERKNYIRESNKLADVMTVSNPNILKSYRDLNVNAQYYPCAYDERLMPEPDYTSRDKVVLWRGSNTHRKSLSEFAPAIGKIDKKFIGWKFVFIGDHPWEMLEQVTQNEGYCESSYMPTKQLWYYTKQLKPAIQIVCLTDNQFTKSRSNMAQLDATIAGAVTIARDWEHFRNPGVITYKDCVDFEHVLTQTMKDVEAGIGFDSDVKKSWEYIQNNQTFKAINLKQWEIVKSLCGDKL